MSISIVSLDQHNFLCPFLSLFIRSIAENVTKSWVCLLVPVGDAHTSSSSHVETRQIPGFVWNGDETNVVGKDINVIIWGHGNSNFEL